MRVGLMRSDGLSEDCYTTPRRGRSSVGRATASQRPGGRSQRDVGSPPVPSQSRTVERKPRQRLISAASAVSGRCCTRCCTFLVLALAACVLAAAPAEASTKRLPPLWQQFAKTCKAEQPATLPGYTGNRWKGVAWEQTTNYTYKGGCGFTQLNWDQHKRPGQPRYMSDASALEQLWACYRIYRFYLNQSGSHRYAATVWDANRNILGWYGFTDAEWKRAHR